MADAPGGPDWEQGGDGKWYAPGVLSGNGWWRAENGRWYRPETRPPQPAQPKPPAPRPPSRPAPTLSERWEAIPTWGRILGIGGVVLLVLIVIGAALAAPEESAISTTTSEAPTTTVSPTTVPTTAAPTTAAPVTEPPAPTTTASPAEAARDVLVDVINDALGDSNRGADRVHEITVPGDGNITISWAIDESLTEGLTKDNGRIETVDILQAVRDSGVEYNTLFLSGTFLLVDQLGNESEQEVFSGIYDRATVDAINFDNFDFKQAWVPGVAFSPFIHPSFVY